MEKQIALGFLPYELQDIVILKNSEERRTITDIKMTQFIKDKKVEFEVQLDDKEWVAADLIERRIVELL